MQAKGLKKFAWLALAFIVPSILTCTTGNTRSDTLQDFDNITKYMTVGWNLGNTMDAHWNAREWGTITAPSQQERLWGNPITSKAMIDTIKASGFNTIRIPVTWYIFTGPGPNYTIDKDWMDRVQEIVDYVINNGMFCILNIHHDDYMSGSDNRGEWECGWLRLYYTDQDGSRPLSDSEKAEMHQRMGSIWRQIAERFKGYDEYLIFEGINEPRTTNLREPFTRAVWDEQNRFLNELLQTFVDTVRASGGNNGDRYLMVTPYFASVGMDTGDRDGRITNFVNRTTGKLRINDSRERLIVSLHYYEPWGFVTAPEDSPWFSAKFDLNVGSVSNNINNVINIIKNNFTSKGIPVIMGETGAIYRDIPGHDAERVKWAHYYIAQLKALGVPVIIWDDGGSFKLFERKYLRWEYPDLAAAIVEASK